MLCAAMKLILEHRLKQPSEQLHKLLQQRLEGLRKKLRIEEARILIERKDERSPRYRVLAHLIIPGPDVIEEGVDHTFEAALNKLMHRIQRTIGGRFLKQVQRHHPLPRKAPTMSWA